LGLSVDAFARKVVARLWSDEPCLCASLHLRKFPDLGPRAPAPL